MEPHTITIQNGTLPFNPAFTYRVLKPIQVSDQDLKPGDTFPVDCFAPDIRAHRVEELCRQRIVGPDLTASLQASAAESDELEKMHESALRNRCRRLKLDTTGEKQELVDRIRVAVHEILFKTKK